MSTAVHVIRVTAGGSGLGSLLIISLSLYRNELRNYPPLEVFLGIVRSPAAVWTRNGLLICVLQLGSLYCRDLTTCICKNNVLSASLNNFISFLPVLYGRNSVVDRPLPYGSYVVDKLNYFSFPASAPQMV